MAVIATHTSTSDIGATDWKSWQLDDGTDVITGTAYDIYFIQVNRMRAVWVERAEAIAWFRARLDRIPVEAQALLIDRFEFLGEAR